MSLKKNVVFTVSICLSVLLSVVYACNNTSFLYKKNPYPMRTTYITRDCSQKIEDKLYNHKIYIPETPPLGIVLLFPAFDGWSAFLEEYAAFFASKNMVCVAVDYYGQRQRGTTLEECFSLVTPYLQNRQIVRERATAIFHFFEKMFPNLDIGAMGFCFGVQSVLELARTQQNLKVAIGAHGLLKSSELPTLETIKSHVLMLQGYSDPMVPPQECLDFAAEMRQHHVADWNLVFFGEVAHSFTDPNTGSFDPLKEREIGRIFDKLAAERVKKWSKHFFQQIFTEK